MAWILQEVPDPKESLGCGSIILIIIGVIVGVFLFAGSESNNEKSKSVPAEIKTEQIQETDVKELVPLIPQTNLQQKEKKTSASTTKSQVKTTVSPTKGTTTVNSIKGTTPEKNVTKSTSDTLTTSDKQTKLMSDPVKTRTSVLTGKERRNERQAKKEARQKEKAKKKNN